MKNLALIFGATFALYSSNATAIEPCSYNGCVGAEIETKLSPPPRADDSKSVERVAPECGNTRKCSHNFATHPSK